MKYLVLLSCLLRVLSSDAQEPVYKEAVQKIREEGLQHSQIPAIAHYLTDVNGPRLTNSPGYRHAVQWAVGTLKSWGLQQVAAEPWGSFGPGWSNEHCYLALTAPYYYAIHTVPTAWTEGSKGPVKAAVLVLDKPDTAFINKHAAEIRGKVVLLRTRDTVLRQPKGEAIERYPDSVLNKLPDAYWFDQSMISFYVKMMLRTALSKEALRAAGAVAILREEGGRDGTLFAQAEPPYGSGQRGGLTELMITPEDFLRLQRLASGGSISVELDVQNNFYRDDLTGYNVVAEIPGSDPRLKEQVVMLGGHLDSWHAGTGATDNGAGCMVMMEAMRILKTLGLQPRRTIRVALWGGEEEGLLGSFGYVKRHYGDPMTMTLSPGQKNVSVYFNLDNGTGKIRGLYLQGNEAVRPVFQSWLAPFADLGATGLTKSRTGATDHLSFDAVGIPAFQFIQDPIEYETRTHHSNMDVYDHLYFDDLKQAATIVASMIYHAAMRDELLPRKPLPKPGRFVFDFSGMF